MRIIRVLLWLIFTCVVDGMPVSAEQNLMRVSGDPFVGPEGSRLVEYRGMITGYWVSIIENFGDGEVCQFAVSLCPLQSGPNCAKDEVSQTRQHLESPWDTALCGIDPCPEQLEAHVLVMRAIENVYRKGRTRDKEREDDI